MAHINPNRRLMYIKLKNTYGCRKEGYYEKTGLYLSLILFMVSGSLQTANAQPLTAKDKTPTANIEPSETAAKTPYTSAAVPKIESFKAGGTPINIPAPCSDLIEVGYDVREQMEIFVPASNRLLCGYMKPIDIPRFVKGEKNLVLSKYASIQVPRRGEYQDFKTNDFNDLVGYLKNSLSDDMALITEESEAEFNNRMASMKLSKVSIDKPVQLGTLFSKPDAYSFGMISTTSVQGNSWTMVIGTTFLRVHNRLLFVYVFAEHKNEKSIAMVRKVSEEWAEAILAANK